MRSSCRLERYLTAYADGELPEKLNRKVEAHIARCAACASELDSIRASDRILRSHGAPAVSDDRWARFRSELRLDLDAVDRESRRTASVREARPVYAPVRRRAYTFAAACVAIFLVVLIGGPFGVGPWRVGTASASNECIVDSIESLAAGYTPMFFSSEDPEMTVIWVFSEEVEGGIRGEGPGAK
ncbi:MAG: zf-HC2 domain-containing protein [Candidatus Eisenbacteria bacterium]|nr:zf-HC2 domain-containing protein [Candidatus Eisenbacteria bacterium]